MHQINDTKRNATKAYFLPRSQTDNVTVFFYFFWYMSYVPESISQINFIAANSCACSVKLLKKLPGRFFFPFPIFTSLRMNVIRCIARRACTLAAAEWNRNPIELFFLARSVFVRVLNGSQSFSRFLPSFHR